MNTGLLSTNLILRILPILLVSCIVSYAEEPTLDKIRSQYIKQILGAPKPATITNYQRSMADDGTWPDINYSDDDRSAWQPKRHVERIRDMARAYRSPGHPLNNNAQLRNDIIRALQNFAAKGYSCPNWWFNKVGVPKDVADAMVLMGDDLPKDVAAMAIKKIVSQANIGMTGQNKVWLAEIVLVRSLFEKDEETLKKARDVILSEIRVTTKEGIQPDWSFHQHGPQQQFGNYGAAFASSILKWAKILHGTELALTATELEVIRNYVLHGTSFVTWRGRLDLSACGRQVYKDCQVKKGRGVVNQIKSLAAIDSKNEKLYQYLLSGNTDRGINTLVGNKHFWRSDMMVHRRPSWYASIKMSSERVIGSETCNSENMLGRNLGNGALYVYRTGDELKNIQPVWDWHRLPGTTTDQSPKSLAPNGKVCRPPTSFVGGVSDNSTGVAVFDFKQDSLSAKKAWFIEKDRIICLGAGISSDDGGQIVTSVQQSLLDGTVRNEKGPVSPGKYPLSPGSWIHHAQIGYHILGGDTPVLNIAPQKGNWRQIYTTRGDTAELSMDVFSIWFDHGKTPKNSVYAYTIYPDISAVQMPLLTQGSNIKVVQNSPTLQAISSGNGSQVRAVFYNPGILEFGTGKTLKTDTPCLVTMNFQKMNLFVADPTQTKATLQLTLNGREISVKLPEAGQAGASVSVPLK